jgi:hypothetical protein
MFWQNTLLIPKEVYHEKEKNSNSIHRNESGVSITNESEHIERIMTHLYNIRWLECFEVGTFTFYII